MKKKPLDKWHHFFQVSDGEQEFMYCITTRTKAELRPYIQAIKRRGDLYRVIKLKAGYVLWDARR